MFVIIEPEIEDYCPAVYSSLMSVLSGTEFKKTFLRIRKNIKKKRKKYEKFPLVTENDVLKSDLIIVFSPYATSHNIKKISTKYKKPILHLEQGFLQNSVICDIGGFWGDANINKYLNKELDVLMCEKYYEWADKYSSDTVINNISKRNQPEGHTDIDGEFIFVPMQYMNDQGVILFGACSYPRFLKSIASYCCDNKIILAIKRHPRVCDTERKNVNKVFNKLGKLYGKYFLPVEGSIHWFCRNCRFMAGMNGGAIVDGFMNKSIIFHCGDSIFKESGAVIHCNDIFVGLEKCNTIDNSKKQNIVNRQRAFLYFLYNKYLLLEKDPYISVFSNEQKIHEQLKHVL